VQAFLTVGGGTCVLLSDGSWPARESNVMADELYDGQRTDLRTRTQLMQPHSTRSKSLGKTFPALSPRRSRRSALRKSSLRDPSLRRCPGRHWSIWPKPVGWIRLWTRAFPAGTEVVTRRAEVLEKDELGTGPLRAAKATDSYVDAGAAKETLEHSLTLPGFRYAGGFRRARA
jgi:alpha-L-rhamnosidase